MSVSLSFFVEQHKRKKGETMSRSTNRDDHRDDIMKLVFSRPGFAADVARALGVSHQNVSAWNRVPPHHVMKMAALLDMPPEKIRPDIFSRARSKR
jgi:lambda repressor-like predicted transcriptional regulator